MTDQIRSYEDLEVLRDLWGSVELDALNAKNRYLNALDHVEKHGFDDEGDD